MPEIVGAALPAADTTIANAGNAAEAMPSDTEITMLEYVPTWDDDGVPVSLPVVLLNVAQAGLFLTLNVSVLPSGSDAVGLKE